MKTYRIAAIPGDGIGKEVIAAGLEVLNACAASDGSFSLVWQTFDWSTDYYKEHGVLMPENGPEQLLNFDAIYFGALGAPDVPDHITLWGLRLPICQPFDQYANVRPTRIFPGIESPQRHGMVMWDEIAAEVAQDFPEVTWDKMLVDAMTARMTLKPGTLDTIVATNLHADILSDLAAALTGSLGIAPTANLNPEGKYPSMFEPIHGSAFDITGKGVANPIGAFWTGALLLDHLGEKKAADRLLSSLLRSQSVAPHALSKGTGCSQCTAASSSVRGSKLEPQGPVTNGYLVDVCLLAVFGKIQTGCFYL
jgi:isocitrate/isopropylmalate dehydrogenase